MKKRSVSDTIAAIATPAGEGGIAVIRISGKDALKISAPLLSYQGELKPRAAKLAELRADDVCDEVLLLYFKAPRSFTGEDVLEIQCHGNYFLAGRIVQALVSRGCRAAEPGEFTRRAFLNGRMDLTKAEGVLDMIHAKSEAGIASAYRQLKGGAFLRIESLQNALIALIASASAALDYPEEDLAETTKAQLTDGIAPLFDELTALQASFRTGVLLREGVRVAIAGVPNVGKSLLLNRLLGQDRAIVTSEAGTTRDTVEESFLYQGVRFILIDTAGIRDASTEAEKKGIERSLAAAAGADLILAVSEADQPFRLPLPANKPVIYVRNKTDLCTEPVSNDGASDTVWVSALNNQQIDTLKVVVYRRVLGGISAAGDGINNLRQLSAVVKTLDALTRARQSAHLTLDCMLSDLNEAYRHLGSVTGVTASDAVVDAIFANFCVGK